MCTMQSKYFTIDEMKVRRTGNVSLKFKWNRGEDANPNEEEITE